MIVCIFWQNGGVSEYNQICKIVQLPRIKCINDPCLVFDNSIIFIQFWEKQSKQIPRDTENSVSLKISKYHGQIQTQGPKLSGNHAPHV